MTVQAKRRGGRSFGQLPDGTPCNDRDKYVAAWRDYTESLVRVTGYIRYSFDPGITLVKESDKIELSADFMRKVVRRLRQADAMEKMLKAVVRPELVDAVLNEEANGGVALEDVVATRVRRSMKGSG